MGLSLARRKPENGFKLSCTDSDLVARLSRPCYLGVGSDLGSEKSRALKFQGVSHEPITKWFPSSFEYKPLPPSTLDYADFYFRQCHAVVNTYDFFWSDIREVRGVNADVNAG